MTSDGDFILDEDRGDLGVATTENHRVSMLAILKRIKSSPGDFLHEKMVKGSSKILWVAEYTRDSCLNKGSNCCRAH